MLTEIYIEALLVYDELVNKVWELWDAGEIDDLTAWFAWQQIALFDQMCPLVSMTELLG